MQSQDSVTAQDRLGPLFILSGPSGTGKSTLIRELLADNQALPGPLRLSVSVTTRPARAGEQDGVDYHFWTRERFLAAQKAFLEWAEVYGNCYGTLISEVEPYRRKGTGVMLDIDTQGWEQVKRHYRDAVSIFVKTSSEAAYEQRLRERGTESAASIQKRLQGARRELARAAEYDYQIINDDLATALANLRAVVQGAFQQSFADEEKSTVRLNDLVGTMPARYQRS